MRLDVKLKTVSEYVAWEVPHNDYWGLFGGVHDMGLFSDGSILVAFQRNQLRDASGVRLPFHYVARFTPDGEEVIWLRRKPTDYIVNYYGSFVEGPKINLQSDTWNGYFRGGEGHLRFEIDRDTDRWYMGFLGRAGRYIFELLNNRVPYDIWCLDINGEVIWAKSVHTQQYQSYYDYESEKYFWSEWYTITVNYYIGTNTNIYNRKPFTINKRKNRLYLSGSYGNIQFGQHHYMWAFDLEDGSLVWQNRIREGEHSSSLGSYGAYLATDPFTGHVWYSCGHRQGQWNTKFYIIKDDYPEAYLACKETEPVPCTNPGLCCYKGYAVTNEALTIRTNPNRIPGTVASPYPGVSQVGNEFLWTRSVNWDLYGNPIIGLTGPASRHGGVLKLDKRSYNPMWGFLHFRSRAKTDYVDLSPDRKTLSVLTGGCKTGLFGSCSNYSHVYFETRIDKPESPVLPKISKYPGSNKSVYPDYDTTIDCVTIHTRLLPIGSIERQMMLDFDGRPIFALPFNSLFRMSSSIGVQPWLSVHQSAHIDPLIDPNWQNDPAVNHTYEFYYEPGTFPSDTPYEYATIHSNAGSHVDWDQMERLYTNDGGLPLPYWCMRPRVEGPSKGGPNLDPDDYDNGGTGIPPDLEEMDFVHFPFPLDMMSMWDELNPYGYVVHNEILNEDGDPSVTSRTYDNSRYLIKSEFAPVLDNQGQVIPGFEHEPTNAGIVIFRLGPICADNALYLKNMFFPSTLVGNESLGGVKVISASEGWGEQQYVPLKDVSVSEGTDNFLSVTDPDNFPIWPNGAIIRFPVKFKPTSQGTFTGKLKIVLDCAGEDTFYFDLEGVGVTPPDEPQKQVPGYTALDSAEEIESEEATYEVDPSTKRPKRRL